MTGSLIWTLTVASVENFVLINVVLCAVTFAFSAIIRKHRQQWHPLSLARCYAGALIIPPLLSAWLVAASLLPVLWIGAQEWIEQHQASHTLHLLNALTVPLDPALGYAALVFALIAAMVATYAAGSAYFRIGRVIRRLEMGAQPAAPECVKQVEALCQQYRIEVGLIVSSYPFSFVWGYHYTKLIVSTGLLNALTAEELAGLLEHEVAHHIRRDNISKLVLTICRYTSPLFPLSGLLYRWWSEQTEMVCDEIAAKQSAPLEVAGALVRLKKLTLATMPCAAIPTASGFFGDTAGFFEQRVMRLLSLSDNAEIVEVARLSRSWARSIKIVTATFVISLIVLFILSPLAIHRALEVVLHIF